MAEMAEWIDGVERTGARTVRITAPDLLALFRRFVTTLHMTRGISAHV
jgi:D-aminopeptidase